jgi:hypothetical protein
MKRHVKIGRLRIRVPVDQAAAPKQLAAEVARRLVDPAIEAGGTRIDTVRARVTTTATGGELVRDIAQAVRGSLRQRGEH